MVDCLQGVPGLGSGIVTGIAAVSCWRVRCRLAGSECAVVASAASAQHLGVVDDRETLPCCRARGRREMARVARMCAGNMSSGFARGIAAVMAHAAGTDDDLSMVYVCQRKPACIVVAGVAIVGSGWVEAGFPGRRSGAGGRMAGYALTQCFCMIKRDARLKRCDAVTGSAVVGGGRVRCRHRFH